MEHVDQTFLQYPEGRAIVVPVRQGLNKYGNMPWRAIATEVATENTFAPSRGERLAVGIYRRTQTGLWMLASFMDRARYRRRLGFLGGASKTANARLPYHLDRAMREAFRTAQR